MHTLHTGPPLGLTIIPNRTQGHETGWERNLGSIRSSIQSTYHRAWHGAQEIVKIQDYGSREVFIPLVFIFLVFFSFLREHHGPWAISRLRWNKIGKRFGGLLQPLPSSWHTPLHPLAVLFVDLCNPKPQNLGGIEQQALIQLKGLWVG